MTSPAPSTPQQGRSREPTLAVEGETASSCIMVPHAVSAPPGSPGFVNTPLRDSASAAEMEIDAALERGSTHPQSRNRSRSGSQSVSQETTRSRHRDEEWIVETHLQLPHHRHPCAQCDNYVEHALWADYSANESLEEAFLRIAWGYSKKSREEITRLQARLDDSWNARERDRWRDEHNAARSCTREFENEIEKLRATTQAHSTAEPTREAASAAQSKTEKPADRPGTEGGQQLAPAYSQTPPLGARPRFASRLSATSMTDETLAWRLYNQQWRDHDKEHEDHLDLEDELWREERDAKKARKGKGKTKAKAPTGPQTTTPGGLEDPVTGDKRKTAPTSPTGVARSAGLAGFAGQRDIVSVLAGATEGDGQSHAATTPSHGGAHATQPGQPIQQAVLMWGTTSNYPATQGENRSGGVLMGANQLFNPVDLTAQFFFNQLQRINSASEHPRGQWSRHVTTLTRVIRGILACPGHYNKLVELMEPGV
ncbi:hypothetical protein BDV93DRAFT_514879 [Ceratobasidium sp. AG-I]|nr:hypothetical protein BDV93DRAFT_514879 [Ceratobasidium sp. AG-I]